MSLSKEREEEMYTKTIETARDITWLRDRLEKGDKRLDVFDTRIDECSDLLGSLEAEQKLLNGKLGFVVLILSVCFTAALHGIGWIVSHFWK
jgi:hypothetical protein